MIYILVFLSSICACQASGVHHQFVQGAHIIQGTPVIQGPPVIQGAPVVTAASSQYFQRSFNRLVLDQPVLETVALPPPVLVDQTNQVTGAPDVPASENTLQSTPLNQEPNIAIAIATAHAAAPVATFLLPPYPFTHALGFIPPSPPVNVPDEQSRDPEPTTTTTTQRAPTGPDSNQFTGESSNQDFGQTLPDNQVIHFNPSSPPINGQGVNNQYQPPLLNNPEFNPHPPTTYNQGVNNQYQPPSPNNQGFNPHPPSSNNQGFNPRPPSSNNQGFNPRPPSSNNQGFNPRPPSSNNQGFNPRPPPGNGQGVNNQYQPPLQNNQGVNFNQYRPPLPTNQWVPLSLYGAATQIGKPQKLKTSVEVVPVPLAYIAPPPIKQYQLVKHIHKIAPTKLVIRPIKSSKIVYKAGLPVKLIAYKTRPSFPALSAYRLLRVIQDSDNTERRDTEPTTFRPVQGNFPSTKPPKFR